MNVFMMRVTAYFLLATGITLIAFSAAYAKDMETLRTVPDAIWDALCGRPSEAGFTLPLLLTVTTLSLIGASVLGVWSTISLRRQQ
jgi:lysylphosphatidylglycerol synthetase-like protein (DUF2156 family)